MPWHVQKNYGGCPTSKPWAVLKDADNSLVGCHETRADAEAQIRALYATEKEKIRDPRRDARQERRAE